MEVQRTILPIVDIELGGALLKESLIHVLQSEVQVFDIVSLDETLLEHLKLAVASFMRH
jgi:hypothetical protein